VIATQTRIWMRTRPSDEGNGVDEAHQNRSLGGEQLDDSIVDTLVSALLLTSAWYIPPWAATYGLKE
jgi:hypothetical protein